MTTMLALQAGRRATCTCLRATATANPRVRLGLSSVARRYATSSSSSSSSTLSSSPSSHPSQRSPGGFPPSTSADAAQGPPSLAETKRSDETPTISARPPTSDSDDRRMEDWVLYHPVYTPAQLKAVEVTRHPDLVFSDKIAGGLVKLFRAGFDIVSGYRHSTPEDALKAAAKQGKTNLSLEEMRKANLTMGPKQWLNRIIFLESVAGVPGMVGATLRHLRSLRLMRRDGGFIATLLEEAENERMHLLTFMKIAQPGLLFRLMVLGAQGVFYNLFFLSYLISPKICHRFVGRLEEEAVITYTNCIKEIEAGRLPEWEKAPAPRIAIDYWRLKEDATLLDVIYAVRADEAGHRFVNHTFANINAFANVAETDFNPFAIQKPSGLIQGTSPGFSRQESLEWYSNASKQLKEGKAAAKSD